MIDYLPQTVPIFRTQDAAEAYKCSLKASKYYSVSPYIIQTVLQTEGGVKGSKVPNSNGTYDYGPMQINDIWVNELKRMENVNVDKVKLSNNICYNIYIGTWILSYRIKEVNGDVWLGLGNYHSKTKKYHNIYMKRAYNAYSQILAHWVKVLKVSGQSTKNISKVIRSSIGPD